MTEKMRQFYRDYNAGKMTREQFTHAVYLLLERDEHDQMIAKESEKVVAGYFARCFQKGF